MARSDGFTLVELLITSAILLLVMVYVTQAFTVQQKTYVVVDQVTEAQQNLRAVSDLVDRDVRLAGYMVPSQAAVCGHDATTGPDRLFVSNADVIRSVFALEGGNEDLERRLRRAGLGRKRPAWTRSGATASIRSTRNWVDVAADGADFAVGAGVILANRTDPERQRRLRHDHRDQPATRSRSTSARPRSGRVRPNADVVAIPAHV